MINLLIELFNTIIKADPAEATVYLIKTKAALRVKNENKRKFEEVDRTKQLLNKVIDRIVIEDEKTATVHFKSGLTMEKTLS